MRLTVTTLRKGSSLASLEEIHNDVNVLPAVSLPLGSTRDTAGQNQLKKRIFEHFYKILLSRGSGLTLIGKTGQLLQAYCTVRNPGKSLIAVMY